MTTHCKTTLIALVATMAMVAGCGRNAAERAEELPSQEWRLAGDSAVYGLTCEGSGDTVLVLLPEGGGDPVRYNIERAAKQGRIMGDPKTGDRTAIVVSKDNPHVAEMVVDIDELKGIWCYIVMPRVREGHELNDSLRALYFIPREYGFALLGQWMAQSIGYVSEANALGGESPVEYPQLGYFTDWHLLNGKLVIASGTPVRNKNNEIEVKNPVNDTCDIVFLRGDSLVLASEGAQRSYYRKQNREEVNKKANQMANELQAKALEETKK